MRLSAVTAAVVTACHHHKIEIIVIDMPIQEALTKVNDAGMEVKFCKVLHLALKKIYTHIYIYIVQWLISSWHPALFKPHFFFFYYY